MRPPLMLAEGGLQVIRIRMTGSKDERAIVEAPAPSSLADASVDPLAQQVDVTHVAGVLLDHADQYLAQRHMPSAAAALARGVVAGDVETGRRGHEPGGELYLRAPRLPCLRHHLRVGDGAVEVAVPVGVGAVQQG